MQFLKLLQEHIDQAERMDTESFRMGDTTFTMIQPGTWAVVPVIISFCDFVAIALSHCLSSTLYTPHT